MGTWGVSKVELVTKLTECLDNIEGDFNNETLLEALEFMKFYSPTADSTKKQDKLWEKKMKEDMKKDNIPKCEICDKDCITEKREDGRIKSISCPNHSGPHASGDFSYLCGSDYCRCCL